MQLVYFSSVFSALDRLCYNYDSWVDSTLSHLAAVDKQPSTKFHHSHLMMVHLHFLCSHPSVCCSLHGLLMLLDLVENAYMPQLMQLDFLWHRFPLGCDYSTLLPRCCFSVFSYSNIASLWAMITLLWSLILLAFSSTLPDTCDVPTLWPLCIIMLFHKYS